MNALKMTNKTRSFGAPTDWDEKKLGECHTLDIVDTMDQGLPWMMSGWRPSADELSQLNVGAAIFLFIQGRTHPVVSMTVDNWTMAGYPFLTIARKYGADYGKVLRLADWFDAGHEGSSKEGDELPFLCWEEVRVMCQRPVPERRG